MRPDLARPYEFKYVAEVKLLRWGESNKGATITLELPPIPIGEGHPFKGLDGQRFRMHFEVLVDDAPEPERVPAPPRDPESIRPPAKSEAARQRYLDKDDMQRAVTRAAMLCTDPRFQEWAYSTQGRCESASEEHVSAWLRWYLEIDSRREIATDERAFLAFKKLEDAYQIESKWGENLR